MKKKWLVLYEVFMFVLVVVSLIFAFTHDPYLLVADQVIWGIFVFDYALRLVYAKQKWHYIKTHPLELIAIIPLDAIFQAARFVHFFRILRLVGIGSRYLRPVYRILKTNSLDKIFLLLIILLFIVPIPIILVEPNINTFPDALWWAIVTTTTVGYGDISPSTPIGRILAVLLMMVGIGSISALTSAITNYFSSHSHRTHDEKVDDVIQAIAKLDHLTEDEVQLFHLHLKRKIKRDEETTGS